MPKVALISGVTGQNGAYPDETLLNKGYVVHGLRRRSSSFNSGRIEHLYQDLHEADVRFVLHYGDLTDATNLIRLIQQIGPDEIYNLGAQGHVYVSFETPEYTANGDGFCRRVWRRSASSVSRRTHASIKRRRRGCTARCRRFRV